MAAPVSATKSWGYLATHTLERLRPVIADNVTGRIFLLHALRERGVEVNVPGGLEIVLPVFKELQTAEAYSDLDVLSVSRADPTTVARSQWKQLAVPLMISGRDMAINMGETTRVLSVLQTMVNSATLSLREGLANSTTGIFSALGDSDKGITGLQTILTHTSSSTPTSGTVAGLSRATYTFWRNQVANVSSDFSANGYTQMHTLYAACTRGDETPDIVVLTRNTYVNFVINATGTFNYNVPLTGRAGALDVGFSEVTFLGALVGFDDYCPANNGYFINSKYLHYVVHPDRNIEIGEFKAPTNQDALVSHALWMGNVVPSNMGRHGLLLNGDTN